MTEDSYQGDPNDPRTLNYYTYGLNNPLKYIDPTGNTAEDTNSNNTIKAVTNFLKNIWNQFLGFSSNYDVKQEEYVVDQQFLDENEYTRRDRRVSTEDPTDSITAIVVHWVGNARSTAQGNRNYFNNQTRYASAHYIVGLEGEVIQAVPDEQTAFHSGGNSYTDLANDRFIDADGNRKHNDWTIGIETCHVDWDGNYTTETYTTMVRLTADLLRRYNLNVETGLLRHYDITNKDCPKLFEGENNQAWATFKSDVEKAMKRWK